MFGAWGPATQNSLNGTLLQLRALDFVPGASFNDGAQVTIYHPEDGQGHAFSVVGFPGLLGAFTGYSSANLGISEKHIQF